MKTYFVILILFLLFLTGCNVINEKEIDYSNYLFTNVNWIRGVEDDIETISFKSDGSYSYSCSCGNPVNDSDLCDGYIYDDETKEIKLICLETTDETVTSIKIVAMSDDFLELDFDGEKRIFERKK